jgi:hypothetical protein
MHQMPPGARPFVVQPGLPAPGERLSHPWCKPCLRVAARERRTGPAQEDFDRLLADQDGRCAICQTVFETGPNPGAGAPRIDRAGDGSAGCCAPGAKSASARSRMTRTGFGRRWGIWMGR